MEASSEQLLQALIRDQLSQYCIAQYPGFELARHHNYIIEHLEQVESGRIQRLMIFLPPQHGKSTLVSKLFPAWYLGRNPTANVIQASYGQDFVKGFGRAVRNFIANPIHTTVFPDSQLSDDSSAAHVFTLQSGGEYFAVGRGGPTTGRGANLIVIDDPLKDRKEASSAAIRNELKEWYSDVIYTRQRSVASIVLVQTRWHLDDLAGWLLREHADEGWTVINLPAMAEEHDPLGRQPGEALWPSHYDETRLAQIQAQQSTSSWLSLYQQRPTIGSGFLFKREWIEDHTYDAAKIPAFRDMNRAILVDPANAQKKSSDYTYMWVIGASEDKQYYVLDILRDRLSLQERGEALFRLHKKWGQPEIVGYEQYGMQADISYLESKMNADHYHFRVQPLAGGLSKPDRIERLEPLFREGRIWMPSQCYYDTKREGKREDLVRVFLDEEYTNYIAGGGGVKHDDGLDALSRIFDVSLNFPTTGVFSQAYRLFNKAREVNRRGTTPWGA